MFLGELGFCIGCSIVLFFDVEFVRFGSRLSFFVLGFCYMVG